MSQVYTDKMIPDLQMRWKKIQQAMKAKEIDVAFITTTVNIYYVLGRIVNGYVYLPQEGAPLVFVRRPIGIEGEHVHYIRKVEQIPEILKELHLPTPEHLLMEADEVSFAEYTRFEEALAPKKVFNGSHLLRKVRSVKTGYEVSQLRQSARLQSEVYRELPSIYRAGMTDHQFTVEAERLFRLHGNLGIFRIYGASMEAFMGSVLAGDNAGAPSPYDFALGGAGMHASLPVGHEGAILKEGTSLMVDISGNFTAYISDLSRTFSIGKLPKKAYDAHQVSIDIQEELALMGKAGACCEELYHKSLAIAKKHKLADCYMGLAQQAKFVGHGVGLVINELPVLCDRNKEVLEINNTIALEPKFIIEGVGAVGTENTYVVTEDGMEKLTFAPEEIIAL